MPQFEQVGAVLQGVGHVVAMRDKFDPVRKSRRRWRRRLVGAEKAEKIEGDRGARNCGHRNTSC